MALAQAAASSPSADNSIRWRLHFSGLQAAIRTPDLGQLAATRRRLDLISLGCVVESLRARSAELGLLMQFQWHEDRGTEPLSLTFTRTPHQAPDPLGAYLAGRHSNRTPFYRGPKLTATQQTDLANELRPISGASLSWMDAAELRAQATSLIRAAEVERFRNKELHEELFSAVRFDLGWTETCEEGLPPGSLAVGLLERPGFKLMRHWSVQRAFNLLGVHHVLGLRSAAIPARTAPHLVVLGGTGPEHEAALSAGRALLRIWTRANAMGLAAQVLAASPLYALAGATAVPEKLQAKLAAGWHSLTPASTPFIVLRLGHAAAPAVRAGRPSAASVVA
ncbi:hypothetical protein I7X39_06415 [Inhella sp. 1Y17]|uniref:Nitroreductase family protein n=2 Tax=Inhella proteolytica TaxID=2795029 RepID=A0A931J564_9BURK|nr:hypothetical protein [Inhella proteolytica]